METNTGIKAEGELEEIAEVSEEMKDALEKVNEHEETIEKFDYWKPEKGDEEENIKNRTASIIPQIFVIFFRSKLSFLTKIIWGII